MNLQPFPCQSSPSFSGARAAVGIGLGLPVAGKRSRDTRTGAAVALLAVGALPTIPLRLAVLKP